VKEDESEKRPEEKLEFFVHWDQFNKRLDEWVSGARVVLSRDLEWPRPKVPATKKGAASTPKATPKIPAKVPRSKSLLKKATTNAALTPSTPVDSAPSPSLQPSLKRKVPHDEQEMQDEDFMDMDADADADADADPDADADADDDMDMDAEGDMESFELTMTDAIPETQEPSPVAAFSKDQEIEKLRTSGSMTQSISEITRVKNLNRIQIGKHEVETWYFSPYPKEYAQLPVLYICEFCLSFFPSPMMLSRHRQRCTMLHPPGNEIYRHEDLSFFEIDGKRQLTWCRNLSLLSKCFLDQ